MKDKPEPDEIDPDAPLRLEDAIKVAFPMGGMTASGLRTEINRGRLTAERIAGKLFVTLNGIKAMRELCRETATVAPAPPTLKPTPADAAASLAALKATAKRLMES